METAGGGGGGGRRRQLLDEKTDSANLRDFLRIKDTDDGDLHSLSGLTLSAVLGTEKPPPQPTRTLLEIIRNDPNYTKESKKTWRAFKDKIRLRRAGNAWTSSVPIPASDIPIQNRMVSRRNSTRFQENPYPDSNSINVGGGGDGNRIELNSVSSSNDRVMMIQRNLSRVPTLSDSRYGQSGIDGSIPFNRAVVVDEGGGDEEEEAEGEEEEELGGGEVVEAPERMSLMALLAETDREMGLDGSGYMEEDEEEEEEEESGGGGGEYNCCVCMVRHKGSAFIPCGHTFCRLCSRELWVQRGNCPLCNGYILEILDIF